VLSPVQGVVDVESSVQAEPDKKSRWKLAAGNLEGTVAGLGVVCSHVVSTATEARHGFATVFA